MSGQVAFDEGAFLAPLSGLLSKFIGMPCEVVVAGAPGAPETKVKTQPGKPGYEFLP